MAKAGTQRGEAQDQKHSLANDRNQTVTSGVSGGHVIPPITVSAFGSRKIFLPIQSGDLSRVACFLLVGINEFSLPFLFSSPRVSAHIADQPHKGWDDVDVFCTPSLISAFCRDRRGMDEAWRRSIPSLIARSSLFMGWKGFISGQHTLLFRFYSLSIC